MEQCLRKQISTAPPVHLEFCGLVDIILATGTQHRLWWNYYMYILVRHCKNQLIHMTMNYNQHIYNVLKARSLIKPKFELSASNTNGLYSLRIELRRFSCLCGFFRNDTDFCRLKYDKLKHILRFSTSQVFDKHKY